MKKIIFLSIFSSFIFAHSIPYCAFENTSQQKVFEFESFLNEETQKVLNELNQVDILQTKLLNILDKKIETLTKLKKVLSQILIMKKQENFELQKYLDLSQYDNKGN